MTLSGIHAEILDQMFGRWRNMNIIFLGCVFWATLGYVEGLKNMTVNIESCVYDLNDDFMFPNTSCSISPTDNSLTIHAYFRKPVTPVVNLQVETYEMRNGQFVKSLLNLKLDVCKFFKNSHSSLPTLLVLRILQSKGNFPKKCPIKGHYYFENWNFNTDLGNDLQAYLPSSINSNDNRWKFVVAVDRNGVKVYTFTMIVSMSKKPQKAT